MPFVKRGALGEGNIVTAGDLTGAVVTTSMNVEQLENLRLVCSYVRGGGSAITALNLQLEESIDGGSNFEPVVINNDNGTPPNVGTDPGLYVRTVAATDDWVFAVPVEIVGPSKLLRFSVTSTGAAAAGDLITIDARSESEAAG